jgi:hypothetical protein
MLVQGGSRLFSEDVNKRSDHSRQQGRLANETITVEIRFRSPTERAAFSTELTEAITKLVSKYHDESAPGGRAHRLVVVAHPLPQKSNPKEPS